jgi:hypothetical protein
MDTIVNFQSVIQEFFTPTAANSKNKYVNKIKITWGLPSPARVTSSLRAPTVA